MTNLRFVAALCMASAPFGMAIAQNATTLSDGKAFAESLAPQSASQIVNPAGVNPAAWSTGSSAIPTSTPSGLGAFSSPLTSSPLYNISGAQGALSGLGNAKILNCKNYVPTGDPVADQECAAVKFMNKDCVTLNNSQLQVVGATGVATAPGVDCSDTYGAGQANFGYQNAVTANDSVFHLTQTAQNNASATTAQNCVSTPVITKPAEYETNECTKTVSTDAHICTQELAVAVTTNYSQATPYYTCPSGTLQGTNCVTSESIPASVTYWCPSGTLSGTLCMGSTGTPASLSYTCPSGSALQGSTCVGQSSIPATISYTCWVGTYNGQSCVSSTAAQLTLACPSGTSVLAGQNGQPDLCSATYYVPGADCHAEVSGNTYVMYCTWPAPHTYSCPNGGTLTGTSCVTSTTATVNYQCDRGILSGANCIVDSNGPATPVYSCETGTLSGDQCITSTSTPANADYHCPAGQTLNGRMCVTSSTSAADVHYSCPGGSTPVGTQCKTVVTQTNWIDNCKPYEQSAGITLGAPR